MTDRELILKRIVYQIEEADKLVRTYSANSRETEYAKGEIIGLTSLREFIDELPAAEEDK
jgi:hypothetical protein